MPASGRKLARVWRGLGVRYTDIGAAENFSLIGNVLRKQPNWGVNSN